MINTFSIKLRQSRMIFAGVAALLFVAMVFQNCSEPLNQSGDVSSVAIHAPFAYDAKLDHLAYMSCSSMGSSFDTNAYFTFKMGAYNSNAGVKLTPDFVNATRNLVTNDKAAALQQSPLNNKAYFQLGIRPVADLQSIYTASAYLPFSDFIGSLSATSVATALAQNNGVSYIKDFPALGSPLFEDKINFSNSEALANYLRTELADSRSLVLTTAYSRVGSPGTLVSPTAGSPQSAFGYGYQFTFAVGPGKTSAFSDGPKRIITAMKEYELIQGNVTGATWRCSSNWQFMIVKPGVDATVNCPGAEANPAPADSTQKQTLDIVRKILPASDWLLNLSLKCAVPAKSGLCYGTTEKVINYAGGTCTFSDNAPGTCPHYVTVCKML